MKKIPIIVIMFLVSVTGPADLVADKTYYMAPYGGGTFVNLDNPEWNLIDENDLPARIVGSVSGEGNNVFENDRLVVIGGIDNIKAEEIQKYGISLSFRSDSYDPSTNYFYFTKQSNPEFRRPFLLQVTTKIVSTRSFILTIYNTDYTLLGTLGGEASGVLYAAPADFWEEIFDFLDGTYFIVYEFGIALPGDILNGVLDINGTQYPIAAGDDYTAEIEMTVSLVDSDNPGEESAPISFTIPFSGYYDPRQTSKPGVDTSASLYVQPNARAANIDLLNDQGKNDIPIASVDFSLFGLESDATYDKEDVFMFLSSSSNPFDSSASKFRFVHKDVGFGDAITDSNSIGYKIRAVPDFDDMKSAASTAGIAEVVFDGTDYLTVDGAYPINNHRMYTACYKQQLGTLYDSDLIHWHSYSGTLYLELDTNNVIMDEGLYRSTVYVHVVTDENISKRGAATA